jgi:hypothetical protein
MKRCIAVLLAGLLVSCGGGGGDTTGAGARGGGGGSAGVGARAEENDSAVTLSAGWTSSDSGWGWSGGAAVQSSTAGATISFSFVGNSVRWIGSRGRAMGIATVSIDGGPAREVDLFARPDDEVHTPIITISDLSDGPHTLTLTVTGRQNGSATGNVVVLDAFDVQPGVTVSHWQESNPELQFSAGWTDSSPSFPWSGNGASNFPDPVITAKETQTAGETVTVPFRGTGISWSGYRGPDGGIATVQIDGGAPTEVDTYSPTEKIQPVVFTAGGLSDANHTITITATGRRNPAATGARIVVDALDIMTPGRRYEEYDSSMSYVGTWDPHRDSRVFSEGASATSNQTGATATFRFTGTSVTWIGCQKGSASGTGRVTLDGVVQGEFYMGQSYPIEGYQMPVFRKDGLAPGPHTLTIEVINTDGAYVVVDAFDVR